jgi:DNA-binding beta-propeller fold protein YncE
VGSIEWARRYHSAVRVDDESNAIAVSPDGSQVFVTGKSANGQFFYDALTIAYNATTGATEWVQLYDGADHFDDIAHAIAVSPDGSQVFITGESGAWPEQADYLTIAYNAATGATNWMERYDDRLHSDDIANAIAVSPDGSKVFVTGQSDGRSWDDYVTYAYNAATGAAVWARRYDGLDHVDDIAHAIAVSPDGSKVFVTGQADDFDADQTYGFADGGADYATYAYSAATGAGLWLRRYNGTGDDEDIANAIAVSPDGRKVFVTGSSAGPYGDADYVTYAYGATRGGDLWVRREDGGAGHDDYVAHAIAVSPDGSKVFVTGESTTRLGWEDYLTYAYSAG